MSITAIVLLLIASFAHATWNLMGKRESPTISFFLIVNTFGFLTFLPFPIFNFDIIKQLPLEVFGLLIITGFFMAVYYTGLAGAYRSGEMSIAYPIARSSPIIVVTIVTILPEQAHTVSGWLILGIVLILAGCFLIPLQKLSEIKLKNYWNTTCLLALLAAFGTAGYSIIDDQALRTLRQMPLQTIHPTIVVMCYLCLQGIVSSFWMIIFIVILPNERVDFLKIVSTKKRLGALTGLIMFSTYGLVLISMAYVKNVSYVVAFRQFSILVGAVFGFIFLKEVAYRPKVIGILIMFIGLVIVGIN